MSICEELFCASTTLMRELDLWATTTAEDAAAAEPSHTHAESSATARPASVKSGGGGRRAERGGWALLDDDKADLDNGGLVREERGTPGGEEWEGGAGGRRAW